MDRPKQIELSACLTQLSLGERRFLRNVRPEDVALAVVKYNCNRGKQIRVSCEEVEGCASLCVDPGVVIRRTS